MSRESLHVIIQYCIDKRPARQSEYDESLRRNLGNPHVVKVHNLSEPGVNVPGEFRAHPKYVEHEVPRWLTYADAFAYASQACAGEAICLMNLDTFLDVESPWDEAAKLVTTTNTVLCLSRWEWSPNAPPTRDPDLERIAFAGCQDAWVFGAPIQVADCDFEIGTLGCDNAIADRLVRAGKMPLNWPSRYRVFHYDLARGKTYANQNAVHNAEKRFTQQPERQGYYYVPDIEALTSLDELTAALGVSALEKYRIICDTFTRYVVPKN